MKWCNVIPGKLNCSILKEESSEGAMHKTKSKAGGADEDLFSRAAEFNSRGSSITRGEAGVEIEANKTASTALNTTTDADAECS